MFLANDNLRKMKKKEPVILGLSYRGLPNGAENANQITNGSTSPQKRSSNQSDSGGTSSPPSKHMNGDSQSQISSDRESQSSSGAAGQLGYMNNPLYGVNAASQYLPSGASTNTSNPSIQNGSNNTSPDNATNGNTLASPINGVRKAPEGQDNESFVHEDELDSTKGAIVSASQLGVPTELGSATCTSDKNGINFHCHVTVTINTNGNTGTLADLKRLRKQNLSNRTSPTESSMASPESPVDSSTIVHSSPLPIQGDVPRFSGNTGDVVGDARSNRCCIIM